MCNKENGVIEEYKEVSSNMRTYINMRFAQLTLFIAITGVLIKVLFVNDVSTSYPFQVTLKIAGLIVGIVFFIMEESATDFFHHYRKRAIELDDLLGFKQYVTRPERKLLTATNGVRILFIVNIAFWITTLVGIY